MNTKTNSPTPAEVCAVLDAIRDTMPDHFRTVHRMDEVRASQSARIAELEAALANVVAMNGHPAALATARALLAKKEG